MCGNTRTVLRRAPSRDEDVGESLVKVLDGLLASTEGTSSKGDALLDRFVDRVACHAQLWSSETTSSVVGWCRFSARALQSVRDGVGLDAYAQRLAHALSSKHAASTYSYPKPAPLFIGTAVHRICVKTPRTLPC